MPRLKRLVFVSDDFNVVTWIDLFETLLDHFLPVRLLLTQRACQDERPHDVPAATPGGVQFGSQPAPGGEQTVTGSQRTGQNGRTGAIKFLHFLSTIFLRSIQYSDLIVPHGKLYSVQ